MHQLVSNDIPIAVVSRRVNLSPTRLRQLFAQSLGRSPAQYLKDLRMQRAARLLRTTFFSVKQITHLVGINDVSHFVRDFKKRYGLTPTEFRSEPSKRKSSIPVRWIAK